MTAAFRMAVSHCIVLFNDLAESMRKPIWTALRTVNHALCSTEREMRDRVCYATRLRHSETMSCIDGSSRSFGLPK